MARRRKPRRGVVLLIVLTLLTLLVVIGLTFVILSGQFRRAAEAAARKERYGDPAQKLMDRAMYQLVRDTTDPYSVLRTHSLLRDFYGESIRGTQVGVATQVAGGQFVQFNANIPAAVGSNGLRTAGFLNGTVLTYVTGNLKNISTRVVGYSLDVNSMVASLRIMLPKRDDANILAPLNGDVFVINGRPFVGTGAGYLPASGQLNSGLTIGGTTFPDALLPNRFGELLATTQTRYLQGGLNESYDAPDYQNVALAAMVPGGPGGPARVLPSFHRVALINYWRNHTSGIWDPTNPANPAPNRYREFRRAVIMRPMPWDHPNFDGGNLALAAPPAGPARWAPGPDGAPGQAGVDDNLILGVDDGGELGWPGSDDVLQNDAAVVNALVTGPWDVDCDGDGIRDSMWLDPGFPIQTDADGRRYKPLFAILCTDMDGKLNLNAHGDLSHVVSVPPSTQTAPAPVRVPTAAGPQLSTAIPLPRGNGYGPPEINLANVFTSVAEYKQLLQGRTILGRNIPGRYGLNFVPGNNTVQTLALLKMIEYPPPLAPTPTNYFLPATPLSAFSSPYDLRGELALGLDYRGLPLHERPTQLNVLINTAYELNLSGNTSRGMSNTPVPDMPYSLSELERLLRANDVDALSLPDRLWYVVDSFRTNPALRQLITTDSYDPPSPGIAPWLDMQTDFTSIGMDRPRHVLDILKAKLMVARGLNGPSLNNAAVVTRLNNDLSLLLSPELVMGVRFDVNRPFGNGRDDPTPFTGNRNNVVDEHGIGSAAPIVRGEEASNETVWAGVPFDHDNDGIVGAADLDAFRARHLYAKHLYVLLMALKPTGLQIDFDGDTTNNSARETAYGLAQWAINAVDFRDADSIMTPFEFDINPFNDNSATNPGSVINGWDVDGILGTPDDALPERGLVWGCERPELLITEAMAFHDRRTEDLAVGGGKVADGNDTNNNFDQRLRPRGSFFLELYNPWAGDGRLPGEFYFNQTAGTWSPGVILNQVTPAGGSPVWRVIVAKQGSTRYDADPDHWDPTQRMPAGSINRSIYFTPFAGPVSGAEMPYFTSLPVAPVMPGRYAVIGSVGQAVDDQGGALDLDGDGNRDYVTTVGRRTDAIENGAGGLNYGQTRRIVLEPSLNPNLHGAAVYDNQSVPPEPGPPNIQPSVGVVVDQPHSFSVTEPNAGYPNYTPGAPGPGGEIWAPTMADYEGAYAPALGDPLDTDPELQQDGTTEDYCFVHLQRLANPLLPYDPTLNPYLTIDSMSTDLTSFNGVTSDMDPNAGGGGSVTFHSRERGGYPPPTPNRELWQHEQGPIEGGASAPAATPETTPLHYFGYILGHTLGYLNHAYHPFYTAVTAPAPTVFPPPLPNRPANFYVGAPALVAPAIQPFPWLTWNNRPFISQYELMLVPTSRSSRLPYEYNLTPMAGSSYAPNNPARFGHLLNFFQTSTGLGVGNQGTNFYRLFELTHVPSRFVDTDLYVNPAIFTGNGVPGTTFFHPPFNHISRYRDPGRINVNTIFSQRIWNGVTAGHPGPSWQALLSSRRGYGALSANVFQANTNVPTFFANPVRAPGEARLVPPTAPASPQDRLDRLGVECTLLRSDSIGYTANPTNPMMDNTDNQPYDNTDRNPYFRYRSLARLGNLLTTRSNVYAVWITMGFFEVEPSPDANTPAGLLVHPDGFRLGQEIGADSGKVKRHRAFYIIDRSVPVAFEPGENHNVDRAIKLRRFIE